VPDFSPAQQSFASRSIVGAITTPKHAASSRPPRQISTQAEILAGEGLPAHSTAASQCVTASFGRAVERAKRAHRNRPTAATAAALQSAGSAYEEAQERAMAAAGGVQAGRSPSSTAPLSTPPVGTSKRSAEAARRDPEAITQRESRSGRASPARGSPVNASMSIYGNNCLITSILLPPL